MHVDVLKHFSLDYKQIIIDEIALDGLEGIGIDLLWRRLEKRISSPVTDKMKIRFWTFILASKSIAFYQLPEPVVHVEIYDRFRIIDEESGHIKDPDDYLDGPYEYCPAEYEYGSCKHYATRKFLAKTQFINISYDKVVSEYGNTLVMVASIEERWRALAQHMPINYLSQLMPIHYCILELVGKSRENGQMTTGKSNIMKVIKEPKTLFYNRKHLQDLDLIRVQYVTQMLGGRGVKSLLLRLKRYHQPRILTMPKVGALHNLVEYLLHKPDYSEKTEVLIRKKMLTQPQMRKLRKTINVFSFDERPMPSELKKSKIIKRRYINLSSKSDESSHSDEDTTEPPLKCQYKVGVSLMRQAYEQFLDAGLKGLTQVELSELLGVEFYTCRFICRTFKSKNIVREFLEDKGRQRTARFIAIASTGKMDSAYAEEKKKFMEYLTENSVVNDNVLPSTQTKSPPEVTSNSEISVTEDKHEKQDNQYEEFMKAENIATNITEIKVLSGFENTKLKALFSYGKNLSLRQLKFANGILKVIKEKLCVCGYQSLSNLVASEIGELPMDTKCLKSFLQKLVNSGHLKLYRVKWPGFNQRYSNFVCAPNVKTTDPIIKAKYKEISMRAVTKKKPGPKKEPPKHVPTKEMTQFSIPRYMKIQKLHEFLMAFVYFNPVEPESHDLPQGFVSVVDFIPEVTVEFALGNITNTSSLDMNDIELDENILSMKLRDTPPNLYKVILQSASLVNTIRLNLKVLAMLGLIQLIYQPAVQTANHNNSGPSTFLLYVNRHAKIVDTKGVWPRRDVDIESLEKSFYFESFDDVQFYWSTVYNISISTKIVLPTRGRKKLMPPLRMANEVESYDNGKRYCDGLGACGFDSCFYMEIPRLWRSVYYAASKSKQLSKKKLQVKLSQLEKCKKQKKKIVKKVVPKAKINDTNVSIKRTRKRISDTAVTWTKEEDQVIMLCKAAITIMSPGSQPGCLTVRNIVARDLLSVNDPKKTQSVCHRRALILESSSTMLYEMQCIINEASRNQNLIQKYDGLLKKIRLRNVGNMSRYMNEARLPMVELVWMLFRIAGSTFSQKVPCVATNLEEFHDKFSITQSTANKLCNTYKTPEYGALKEAIVLMIMMSFNYEASLDVRKKMYTVFRTYPELSLRIALDQLRKSGAVSAKEKVLNNQMHKFNFKDLVQTSYKISANYQRKWVIRLNSEFAENLADIMDSELSVTNVKGSSEINCLFCEMQACDALEITSTTVPVIIDKSGTSIIQEEQLNVIDIETNYKLKSGTLGWKNKCNKEKFADYDNESPQFEEILQSLSGTAVVEFIDDYETLNYEDKIISHLKCKNETGSTFDELRETSGYDAKSLIERLKQLESESIIKRVGFYDNVIVLTEFTKSWSVKIGEKHIIPTPWLTLDGRIRYDIFLKWAGVIMSKIFEYPGCSITYLSDVCEFISNRAVQDICMFLERSKCVALSSVMRQELDLFSDDDDSQMLCEFNQYDSVHNILVHPMKNCLTKYSYLRKSMLEKFNISNTDT